MLNDRQRVELTLAPVILLDVLEAGAVDPKADDVVAARTHLVLAATEVLGDLPAPERAKIIRRSERAFTVATAPYRKAGDAASKLGLIAFYWLQDLVTAEYFVLAEDSQLQKALDLLLPALEPAANIPAMDASARKQATKFLRTLQGLGYFRGVPS